MHLPPETSSQAGRFSYAQARAAGITRRALDRAVAAEVIEEMRPCVYAVVGSQGEADPVAAHRALLHEEILGRGPGWVGARRSAALVMGLPLIGRAPTTPQLARDARGSRSHGDRHARVTSLPPEQLVRYAGVLLTSPARTVVDLARKEPFRNAVVAADAALRRGVPLEQLNTVLAGMSRWPGAARARAVLRFANGRSEGPGESLVRVALHLGHGSIVARPQVEVWRYGEFVARCDLLIEEGLLVIEFNGAVKFTAAGVLPALIGRQEVLRSCGLDVLNTDWDEAFGRPTALDARVAARLAERTAPSLARGVELRYTAVRRIPPSLDLPILAEERAA